MAAKTQDAAGPHATHQPPCPFAGTLRTHDWRERGCCCIEPATPRETAIAAPPSGDLRKLRNAVPDSFVKYMAANYSGDVTFSDPAWHARRIWWTAVALMEDLLPPSAAAPQEPRGEPGEWMVMAAMRAKTCSMAPEAHEPHYAEHIVTCGQCVGNMLRAALSSEAPDAD